MNVTTTESEGSRKANMAYRIRPWHLVERCMTPWKEDSIARTVQASLTHLQKKGRVRGGMSVVYLMIVKVPPYRERVCQEGVSVANTI